LDSIRYKTGVPLLLQVEGSAGVELRHTDASGAKRLTDGPVEVTAAPADGPRRVVVDQEGNGNFRTIQEAINSLPDDASWERVILIHPGTYREKLLLNKSHVVLQGMDSARTIITQSEARDIFRCAHKDDWGVATLNVSGSDITLDHLTIINNFGFEHQSDTTVACADSTRRVSRTGHQMALRTFATTRLKALHCAFSAYGGDTVSPWNVQDGLFYFGECTMEGGVDFYCPRGWAYAEGCTFRAYNGPACIWHDGSAHADEKSVLRDCRFEGYDGFRLGRFHRDAQFFLVNCTFDAHMADAAIYLVPTTNVIQWGLRTYYCNCHRASGDYAWFADNLEQAPGAPRPDDIRSGWVFGANWDPETNEF
jgi:pectinesterase